MIGDPNWLYSTIAQSSAAIVAIVGGFITHSVLTLAAEKRSLTNQKRDKKAQLGRKRKQSKELTIELKELEIEDLTENVTYELLSAEELPSLEDLILAHAGTQTLDLEISRQECERLYKQALEAKNFIGQHSDKINIMNAVTFDEWVRTNNFDIPKYNPEMLEREYNRAEEKQRKSLSKSEHLILGTRQPPIISPYMPPIISPSKQRKLESLREKVRENTDEIRALEHDINDLKSRINTFSYPSNWGWGLVILGCFALVSIYMPVQFIMAEIYSKSVERFIFGCFVAGLVAVCVYIALLTRELRRK